MVKGGEFAMGLWQKLFDALSSLKQSRCARCGKPMPEERLIQVDFDIVNLGRGGTGSIPEYGKMVCLRCHMDIMNAALFGRG